MKRVSAIFSFVFMYIDKRSLIFVFFLIILKLCLSLPMPIIQKYLIDSITVKNLNTVIEFALLLLFVGAFQILVNIYYSIYYNKFVQSSLFQFRNDIIRRLFKITINTIKKYNSSYLLNRIFNDTDQLQAFTLNAIFSLIQDVITFVVGVILVLRINYRIASILLILLPCGILLYYIFKAKIYIWSYKLKNISNILYSKFNESLSMIETIKKNSWSKIEENKFKKTFNNYLNDYCGYIKFSTIFSSLTTSINLISSLIVLIVGVIEIRMGRLSFGGLVAINASIQFVVGPIYNLLNIMGNYQNACTSYDRLQEIYTIPVEIWGDIQINKIDKIEVRSLFFKYNDRFIINDFNFIFEKGNLYIISGQSGSGKTTLINILLGLYQKESGNILIDGIEIFNLDIEYMHKYISLVEQEPRLFNDTFHNNLVYGIEGITTDKLYSICEKTGLLDVILRNSEGFDTIISENSSNLSGGEKQRIALCRALLKDSDVIILDEPSSALDNNTAFGIVEILKELKKNKIIIVISHSIEIINQGDIIISM